MAKPSKAALVRHILKPHGDAPALELTEHRLTTWNLDELLELHENQMSTQGLAEHCASFGPLPEPDALPAVPAVELEGAPNLPVEFADAFDASTRAVLSIGTTLLDLVNQHKDDLRGVAATQLLVETFRKDLALLIEEITPILWEAMGPGKSAIVDGVGVLEKDSGRQLKGWQHDDVWSAMRRKAIADQYVSGGTKAWAEGQTYNPKRSDIVNATIDLVMDVVSKGSYKTTGLRNRLGLDADEVAEVSWGKRRVNIIGGGK